MNRLIEALNSGVGEPLPLWVAACVARIDRETAATPGGFAPDNLRTIAAAYGYMGRLIETGEVPEEGDRDEHLHAFLAKMHGLGTSEERAHALYDEFLQTSGGAAPDGWPNDEKSWAKIRRIWLNEHGTYSAPGSELSPLVIEPFAAVAGAEPELSPEERRWRGRNMVELITEPAIEFYDAMKTIPHYRNGGVAMTYGPGGHHKTNVWISRSFELWTLPEPPRIVFASGEGAQGLGARFAAQCRARDLYAPNYADLFLATEVPLVANLDDMNGFAKYLVETRKFRPDILVIDTWSTALAGMDEDHKAAALLTNTGAVGQLARALKCLIVVIHHTGKDRKGWRGGVGFGWNTDMVNHVEADADQNPNAVRWHVERMKDGASGHSLYYAIEHSRGVPVPMRTSQAGYELLTGKAKWEGDGATSTIGGALAGLGAPVSSYGLVMELYPRGDMDPEDWQARCTTLARKLERAEGLAQHHTTGEGGRLWRVAPSPSPAC